MKTFSDYIKTGALDEEIRDIGEKYPTRNRINVDFKDLERFDLNLADKVRQDPDTLGMEFAETISPNLLTNIEEKPLLKIGFKNIPTEYSPQNLNDITERHIGKIMRLEGMIGQLTDKYPVMTEAYWRCNICDESNIILQDESPVSKRKEPYRCRGCQKKDFRLLMDESRYTVAQTMVLMEKPDVLRAGERPPSLQVYLSGDLTKLKFDVMSKIVIDGVLKIVPSKNKTSQKYVWYLKAYNLEVVDKGFDEIEITPEEEEKIKEMSKNPNLLQDITDSIAPDIHGHNELKQADVLTLFGGTKKLINGIRKRHWINLLIMGDPGVAKSRLLMYLQSIAPNAIYTTGTGSRLGGLTTSAEKDTLTGEWMIKPGVIPIASGGCILIDEFNRLSIDEANALEEPMEMGTCTAAKAGKNIKFNAETAHICVGNPKLGRFDMYTDLIPQFGISPPILSRFDLIFILRDVKDTEKDREIAKAIFKAQTGQSRKAPLDKEMVRKYIAYAKQNINPQIDHTIEEKLENYYVEARRAGFEKNVTTATPRNYEALIRLAEASAKVRLDPKVREQDVDIGIAIIQASNEQLSFGSEVEGMLDVDTIVTGKPKNQRDQVSEVLKMIDTLSKADGMCDHDELIQAFEGEFAETKIDKILNNLKTNGLIYNPKYKKYMVIHD